ncbi:hypothetical protein SISSUDRAFT_1121437 [Sistotremastrum suecicum HHB10207 ss-3]|uniref:SGNH hydrolase-type esterase domain-containing protein n=1 Tax=Sistotremastrum suecicum HHB10207 ss-3 TaxID=1314776 RepID=A0A166AUF2_9AGAM|nr:hypothetical protein SISSUDRAFT_1121437 [Sistotremastrum suecicum HHB10207 ss-3]
MRIMPGPKLKFTRIISAVLLCLTLWAVLPTQRSTGHDFPMDSFLGSTLTSLSSLFSFKSKTSSKFPWLRRLVIFGDSYSSVKYNSKSPSPSKENPLGVKFPGITSCERGTPNWVGHFIKDARAPSDILVYDYAVAGHTTDMLPDQSARFFREQAQSQTARSPRNIVCFSSDHEEPIKRITSLMEDLYNAGGRNFLLIDIPPMNRTPAATARRSSSGTIYQKFNAALRTAGNDFVVNHQRSTVLLFSSFDLFNQVLDEPEGFDFEKTDVARAGGGIWVDRIHPTTGMHKVVADALCQFLEQQSVDSE